MFESALKYVLGLVIENEEVKKFPKDFITASMKWVRSWFLVDDPIAEAVINTPGNEALKKTVVEQKLPKLLENEQFIKELQAQIQAFAVQRERLKNVLDNSNVEVQENIHIGDRGAASGDDHNQKNVIKDSTLKAGGDFRLGDDIVRAGGNVHVGDVNYYGGVPGKPASAAEASDFKKSIRSLIAANRAEEALPQIIDYIEMNAPHFLDDVLLLSGRWDTLARKERTGVLSNADANLERNQIVSALLGVVGKLK